MASDWTEATIDQLKAGSQNAIAMGPFGSRIKTDNFVETGVPVIRGGNLSAPRLLDDGFVYVTEAKADELRASIACPGDIVITHRGTLGQVGIIPENARYPRYIVSQSQMKLSVDRAKADPLFILYFLRSPAGQHQLLSSTSQVGVPAIAQPTRSLKAIEVPLPPTVAEQRAIAHILGTLDDKIEVNRRLGETLEAMARAIFTSWFVDFDPVRAKASGEAPDAICRRLRLTPDLLALFPDRLQDSELGEIPQAWEVKRLGDLCERVAMGPFGSDIKTSNFVPDGVPVIRGGNLPDGFAGGKFVFLTEAKADELRNANARPGDIVITHRGTLGQVGLIPSRSRYERYVVSQSQMVLTIKPQRATPRFVYEFLRSATGRQALLANTSQVGVPAIARPTTSVRAISLVCPPPGVQRAFGSTVEQLFDGAHEARRESGTLASLRDALLPKLISGELRVAIDGSASINGQEETAC